MPGVFAVGDSSKPVILVVDRDADGSRPIEELVLAFATPSRSHV